MKIALFVLGILLGINIGYVIMIPTVNTYKKTAKECISSYEESINHCVAERKMCDKVVDDIFQQAKQCVRTLTECEQNLGLLEGRSK